MYRAVWSIIPMPWDWPVEVNYHEARAFLNWKVRIYVCLWLLRAGGWTDGGAAAQGARDGVTYRMPTEAEHARMRGGAPASLRGDGSFGGTCAAGAAAARSFSRTAVLCVCCAVLLAAAAAVVVAAAAHAATPDEQQRVGCRRGARPEAAYARGRRGLYAEA